jgi:hypothetical protein
MYSEERNKHLFIPWIGNIAMLFTLLAERSRCDTSLLDPEHLSLVSLHPSTASSTLLQEKVESLLGFLQLKTIKVLLGALLKGAHGVPFSNFCKGLTLCLIRSSSLCVPPNEKLLKVP